MATRLYFHEATSGLSNLPTAEQSSLTTNFDVDAQTVNRTMTRTIGTTQTSKAVTHAASTARTQYFTRFVSDPLDAAQTSIAANTWTYNFAARETVTTGNFPVNGNNAAIRVTCYVWRPGTGKLGNILDGTSSAVVDEGGANVIRSQHCTFTGAAVASTQAGDVICIEIIIVYTPTVASCTCDFFYDGTTVTTTETTVSNHASFLETPEDIRFSGELFNLTRAPSTDTVTVTESLGRQRTAVAGTPQQVKVGVITKDTTTGTHTQNFTNELGFAPQWGIFIMSGKTAAGSGAHIQNSVGITDGTNHYCLVRRCIDTNSGGATTVVSHRSTDNFTMGLDATVSSSTTISEGRASWGSNGFDIIWDKADTTANKIIYIIGGGGGFDDVLVKSQTVGSTPWQYTSAIQGDIVFFLASTVAIDTLGNGPGIGLGVATSSSSRWVSGMSTAAGFASNGKRFQRTDRCYKTNLNGSTARALGDFDGFLSNGFDLNFSTSTATDTFGALMIKGGLWDIGSFNQNTSNGTQQVNITSGRTPTGLILATFGNAATTSDVADGRLSIGVSNGTATASIWDGFGDAQASAYQARSDYSDTKIIRTLDETTGGQTLQTEADWSAFGSGSFTINNTTTDATSREICYVTFTPETTSTSYQGTPSTDSTTISDASINRMKSALRVPSTDSSTISDSSLSRMISATRAPSTDTATISDVSVNRSKTWPRVPSTDSSTITDSSLVRMLSATRAPSTDTLTTGESPTRMLSALRLPSSDSVTVADVSRIPTKTFTRIGGPDTIGVSDSSLTRLLSGIRSPSLDSIISGESLNRILSASRITGSDTTTVADVAITQTRSLVRTPTTDDTTVVDSSLTRLLSAIRLPSIEVISASDSSVLRVLSALRLVTPETITTSENITTTQSQAILRTASDDTAVTDVSLTRVLSATRVPSSETVTVADSSIVRMLQLVRTVSTDTISLNESISSALTTPGQINRSVTDNVSVVDSSLIRLLSSARTASDTTLLGENLQRFVSRSRTLATDTITIADVSVTRVRSLTRLPTQDTMNIIEASLIRLLSASRSASDIIPISEVQSEIAHARALLETVNVTEPLLERIVSASRSLNDIVNISEAVFYSTYHKFVFDTVTVGEQLFSIRQSLTGAVTYATPDEVRPLLGNIGPSQRTDAQINLAIDAAYDEINTKTNRIPPNDWKDTDHNFGVVKKLTRYIAAKEMAIGIKDYDTKPLEMEIEHLFNDLLTYDTTSDATQDIVGSSPDVTYALNEGGIIWSTRYPNLKKGSRGENDTDTINPNT